MFQSPTTTGVQSIQIRALRWYLWPYILTGYLGPLLSYNLHRHAIRGPFGGPSMLVLSIPCQNGIFQSLLLREFLDHNLFVASNSYICSRTTQATIKASELDLKTFDRFIPSTRTTLTYAADQDHYKAHIEGILSYLRSTAGTMILQLVDSNRSLSFDIVSHHLVLLH